MSGKSGTGRNGINYYYLCLSKRKKKHLCKLKPIRKQELEDTVINATAAMLKGGDNIHFIAASIYEFHKRCETDNFNLNSLIAKRTEAEKASSNIIKAIEMGIITEQTKQRLTGLKGR